jgi:phosphoribosylformylglycinamidine (FGAM) synthase-like enzyme
MGARTTKGMGEACKKFNTPVTGGNVSFYNQASINGEVMAVFPTPVIGMIGVVEKNLQTTLDFKKEGQTIYLLGKVVDDINCSEYLYSYKGVKLDFDLFWPRLNKGGFMAFHDIASPDKDGNVYGTRDFWAELKKKYKVTFEFNKDPGVGIIQKL